MAVQGQSRLIELINLIYQPITVIPEQTWDCLHTGQERWHPAINKQHLEWIGFHSWASATVLWGGSDMTPNWPVFDLSHHSPAIIRGLLRNCSNPPQYPGSTLCHPLIISKQCLSSFQTMHKLAAISPCIALLMVSAYQMRIINRLLLLAFFWCQCGGRIEIMAAWIPIRFCECKELFQISKDPSVQGYQI